MAEFPWKQNYVVVYVYPYQNMSINHSNFEKLCNSQFKNEFNKFINLNMEKSDYENLTILSIFTIYIYNIR